MDEDKGNPNSQPPSPLPSCLEDEALSGQWLGAVGGSDLPLSETEEGPFAHVDDDWIYDTDQDFSQCAHGTAWEEEETLHKLYRWEEVRVQGRSQRGTRRHRELYEFEEDVKVQEFSQWHDGRRPELYQREESVRRQDLYEWEEDGMRYRKMTLWEEHVTVQEVSQREEEETHQELSQWGDLRGQEPSQWGDVGVRELSLQEGERYPDLPQWEEDVREPGLYQWKDKRDTELSQVGDKTDKEQHQEEDYSAQELPQREDRREKKLSQWEEDVSYNTWDRPWCPVNTGDTRTAPQEGPSSASSVGTEGAAEAARDLPSPAQSLAPAPHSPSEGNEVLLDTNQYITSEIVRKAELVFQQSDQQLEEQRDLEQTVDTDTVTTVPAERTEGPVPAPQSPPESSQALLDMAKHIITKIVRKAVRMFQGSGQQPEERKIPEQSTATEMGPTIPAERTESLVPAPHRPCSPPSPSPASLEAQALSEQQEEAEGESVLAVQETDEGALVGEEENCTSCIGQDQSQGEGEKDPELSQGEEDVTSNISDNALGPVNDNEGLQTLPQEGPSSASSMGTEGTAEAARDLPSLAPAQGSARDAEQAAAAPAGAAEEEEPQGPLAPVEEEAEGSPALGEQMPSPGTQSPAPAPHSSSEGSKALVDTDQSITSEVLSEPELEIQGSNQQPEEQRIPEQTTGADTITVPTEKEESSVPAPQSPCSLSSPSPSQVGAQALREQEEGAGGDSVLAVQETDEGPFAGEGINWKYYVDQEISQWEDEGDQELSQEEINTYQEASQCADCIEQELSLGQVKSYQELSVWEEYSEEEEPQGEGKSYQEVSDWEENIEQEQSQGEDGSSQEVSDWEENSQEEEPQEEGKSYQEVSDWEENIEQGQPQGEESGGQNVSDWEEYSEEELSHGGVKSYQEVSDWEENIEQEQPQGEESGGQEVSDWEEYREKELLHGVVKSYQEVSDWEDYTEEEQSQEVKRHEELSDMEEYSDEEQSEEVKRYEELSDKEVYSKKEQSHGKGSSSSEVTDLEGCSMQAQPQRKFSNYQELLSDWEDSSAEELCQDEDSFGQDFSDWGDYRPSVLSRWEDDSNRELTLVDWERMTVHSSGAKPLLPEEDEWEEMSILELSQGEGTEHRLRILAEEGLPVPVPREAWAQCRAPALCTQVPVCTSPPPGGTEASPAFDKRVAEAGTQSQVPAPRSPCCPPSPWSPQLEAQALSRQLALPKRHLSRFRRALGALRKLFCSCTAGQPQD